MDKRKEREMRERQQNFMALFSVSSLAVVTVVDFMLAYLGGDWLDNYFQTGDHTFRMACFGIALLALYFSLESLVNLVRSRYKEDAHDEI